MNKNKNKHLILSDRVTIETYLNQGKPFKVIGSELGKAPTTNSLILYS
jgi:IS30 family transposase